MVLVTIGVVQDTPLDCHFSAWSRPKPAPDPLRRLSVASGVIPTKGGRNGPVPAASGRAPQGRWRSSPWKRCNHAAPRGRVREHPAPLGALRHSPCGIHDEPRKVREHPAPLGALRLARRGGEVPQDASQGAPRTARCIKTPRPGASTRGHGRSGTAPHLCVTSSPPHGRTTVTSSKGSNRPGPSPLAATTHRGTFCAERDVLRTK